MTQNNVKIQAVWLYNFVDIYQKLSTNNLELLADVYHSDVTFIDPIHRVDGFEALASYFSDLYANLSECDFIVTEVVEQENQAAIYWEMSYKHEKLNKGKPVSVSGSSHIKSQDGKVIYHRDFLDLGVMIYEQIPLLGRLIKWIKVKAAN